MREIGGGRNLKTGKEKERVAREGVEGGVENGRREMGEHKEKVGVRESSRGERALRESGMRERGCQGEGLGRKREEKKKKRKGRKKKERKKKKKKER